MYTASTSNATNNVKATPKRSDASVSVWVNGSAHTNNTSATWQVGENEVAVWVRFGTTEKLYVVVVTKSGTLGALTMTVTDGVKAGEASVAIAEALTAGNSYKYKTALSVALPELDDDLSAWNDWDGESDIAVTDGNELCIAEVNHKGQAKAVDKETVTYAE